MMLAVTSRSFVSPTTAVLRAQVGRGLSTSASVWEGGIPDSVKRVGQPSAFPNEYPGMVYEFNWALNGDGVTPLRRAAFRINKPLDLKVAGLVPSKKAPLKVKGVAIPEAGSDKLSFDEFDRLCQDTRDSLSLAKKLYCPEGHVPGTQIGVRVISNSPTLSSDLLAYLDRCPKLSPPESMPITCFVLEGNYSDFGGFSIEEIEVPIPESQSKEAKSVASVVVTGKSPKLAQIVGGIEESRKLLDQDEIERAKNAKEDDGNQ